MAISHSVKMLSVLVSSSLFISACGGGGGDSSGPSQPAQPNTPSSPTSPPDKPTGGTAEAVLTNDAQAALLANNEFSLARSSCGLGGLTIDNELNAIAIKHANYIKYVLALSTPTTFNPHFESQIANNVSVTGKNNPFFSGESFSERLKAASFSNTNYGVTENIAQTNYYSSAGTIIKPEVAATSMAKSLLAAPYHLRSLMLPSSSAIGTSVVSYTPYNKPVANNQGFVLVTHGSATAKTQNPTVTGTFTYPCQDTSNVVTALYNETPDPVKGTGRNLATDPIGHPIYIHIPSAKTIKVSNVKFVDMKRNITVPISLLDHDNDPHQRTAYQLPNNEAFILPLTDNLKSCEIGNRQGGNCGLNGDTPYRVSFDVLVDNKNLETKSFTFTTGKVSY